MKDAVATMGDTLPDDVAGRDAVHVAVISATATTKLSPGQDVRYQDGNAHPSSTDAIGIVDPFIKRAVMPGERFWLFLYPRSITGLRHDWTHPAFEDGVHGTYATPNSRASSEAWMRDFASTHDCPGYEELMAGIARAADGRPSSWDDDYLHFDGSDAHGEIPDEFWVHAEVVLGRPILKKPKYFSCAC